MKYTQIFVCIIARGQIARDRAMGPYFIEIWPGEHFGEGEIS